jgi:dihydropyrimidinase
MERVDLVIKNGKLVIPRYGVMEGSLAIRNGKVVGIFDPSEKTPSGEEIDVRGKYVMPGVIDPHSHVGYPKANFNKWMETETPGMAVGGVTTAITFYRQYGRPPAPITEFYDIKQDFEANSYIDFSFHFMIATKEQEELYPKYINEYGVNSFKFSMAYKGEEGKALGITNEIDDGFLFESFAKLSKYPQAIACIHCENVEIAFPITKALQAAGRNDLAAYTEARPDYCEAENMRRVFYFGELTGCTVYVVHMSEKKGLLEIGYQRARGSKAKFYIETCSHYLTHTKDSPVGILGKVNPPFRTQEDIDALWEGLADGRIDTLGSDHCDITIEQKKNDIWKGVPGFAGSGMILPVLLSEGVNKGRLTIERAAEVSSYNTAKIFGLYPKKGTIQVGSDADLAIVDLNFEQVVTAKTLPSAADFSIYEGWKMKGWPVMTIIRGEIVAQDGKVVEKKGFGRFVARK